MSVFTRLIVFFVASLLLVYISRKALRLRDCHGFYRFFAFESIAALVLYNQPHWFVQPFAPLQCLSWLLLVLSVALVLHGLVVLAREGGRVERDQHPANMAFENTSTLVNSGVYRYIRHPMYASLLFLALGAWCKNIDIFSTLFMAVAVMALMFTARREELENIEFFGTAYTAYMQHTRMFIPFLF